MAGVIVALDTPDRAAALSLVDRLGNTATFYKVGLELFSGEGPEVVRALRARGKRVFLDLKLHDIPNTVAGAVRRAVDLEVELLTVHVSGGVPMLEAASEAAEGRVGLLGVTVLTSMSAADVEVVWGREILSIREEVQRMAQLADEAGLAGAVASALEVGWIRPHVRDDFLLVTPGIRLAGNEVGDQKRVATPASAVEAGSDYLVVGRTVTAADDPAAVLARVLADVRAAAPPSRP